MKLFTETVLVLNLQFQEIILNLQGSQVHHSKEREIYRVEAILILTFTLYIFVYDFRI